MLKEAVEVFGRLLEESGRLILDAHIPKPGTYRLIEMRDDGWRIIKTLDLYYGQEETGNGWTKRCYVSFDS